MTLPVHLADPVANAAAVIEQARACHDDSRRRRGVPRAVPDRLLGRRPVPAGHAAGDRRGGARRDRRGERRPDDDAGDRRAGRARQPGLQRGGRRPPRLDPRRRPEVLPAQLPRVLRAALVRTGRRPRAGVDHRRRPGRPLRPRPDLPVPRRPRPRPARRGVRGHVGAGAAERGGRAGRRDGARQPQRLTDHDRPRGGPAAAGPQCERALLGGVRLCRGRAGRVDDRPELGRPDDGLRVRLAARRERAVPRRAAPHGRRRRPRPGPPGADASGDLRRQPPHPPRAGQPLPHRRVGARAADRRHRAAAQGRPLPVRARRRRAARPRLLRGLQHPGLRPRAAAQRHRLAQGRDRRERRPRLDPRADRRLQGDGPARPPAQRRARLHDARLRDRGDHQVVRHPALAGARRDLRGARHPARGRADAQGPRPPLRPRREGLRRHLRERPGRAALRLPLPARQPARRHRRRHRRPLRARARVVHLRRGRPDVALHGQRRRPEDARAAPDPLGDQPRRVRRGRGPAARRRSSSWRSPPS